jgi:hypothetical protein
MIRPTVNWKNVPTYKLLHIFTDKINELIPLPNICNVKNIIHLIQSLKEIPTDANTTFVSSDIANMYTNTPIHETKSILSNITEWSMVNPDTKCKLLNLYNLITNLQQRRNDY